MNPTKQHIDRRAVPTGATIAMPLRLFPPSRQSPTPPPLSPSSPCALIGTSVHREIEPCTTECGHAHEAAWAEAEAILEREGDLYDQIVVPAPRSIAGIIVQASVAAGDMEESFGPSFDSDNEDQEEDVTALRAYRILGNIACFA